MTLEELIVALSHDLDLDAPLQPKMPGVYQLPLDEGGFNLTISKTREGILLFCQVAGVPKQKREALYEELLLANLFGQGTAMAVLGLTNDGEAITLSHYLEREIDYVTFSAILEEFIGTVDFWRSEVETADQRS